MILFSLGASMIIAIPILLLFKAPNTFRWYLLLSSIMLLYPLFYNMFYTFPEMPIPKNDAFLVLTLLGAPLSIGILFALSINVFIGKIQFKKNIFLITIVFLAIYYQYMLQP